MDSKVQKVISLYPKEIAQRLYQVRTLIYATAQEHNIGAITETLKWGEPSYISPVGSTIRLGWKKQTPDNYYVYFHCKTSIIETIKEVYGEKFSYQGNRALVFNINQTLNNATLAHCLSLSLKYKKNKALTFTWHVINHE